MQESFQASHSLGSRYVVRLWLHDPCIDLCVPVGCPASNDRVEDVRGCVGAHVYSVTSSEEFVSEGDHSSRVTAERCPTSEIDAEM